MAQKHEAEWMNEAPVKERVSSWIKTTRIQTAMVTALAIWIGHISVKPMGVRDAIILGLIGVLVHIWGFTLNEVEDYNYDKLHDDAEGHPIAQGKVHAGSARVLAWLSAIIAVGMLAGIHAKLPAVIALMLSFIPGYAYDKWSKTHWWSNGYLSLWAVLMVLTGALYAGLPTIYTTIIATAVGIQIFIQVVQGDLKDLRGAEHTFAETCGVRLNNVSSRVLSPQHGEDKVCNINTNNADMVSYSRLFVGIVYGLKALEVGLIFALVYLTLEATGTMAQIWAGLVFVVGIAFIATVSAFMVYVYDRDEIKQKSSTHELLSILLLGLAVVGLDPAGAALIAVAPIVWYLGTNVVLHSSALNPDI